jgi:CRP-like cAMP-binding protein
LPKGDLAILTEQMKSVSLPRRTQLELPNKAIEYVYFVESGIVSIVASTPGSEIEIGVVGREGMTGHSVIHLSDRSPYGAYMQIDGTAHRAAAGAVRELMRRSEACRQLFLGFTRAFMIQTSETVVANARATVLERLARWLLMAHDRVESNEIPLTHEFLAMIMGTRRPSVTEACHQLARQGLIDNTRGKIIVIDREGLERFASGYYGVSENEYTRLVAQPAKLAAANAVVPGSAGDGMVGNRAFSRFDFS